VEIKPCSNNEEAWGEQHTQQELTDLETEEITGKHV
jgi:hypothetical protein